MQKLKTGIPRRELVAFAAVLLCLHAVFTMTVRGYVVPQLTPGIHWNYGLQTNSDSQAFQEEAVSLVSVMQQRGWNEARAGVGEGLTHTGLIATLYYITGTQSPYIVYALNGLIYVINGLLLFAFVHRSSCLSARASFAVAALLSTSPLYLFAHSELLREPFAILGGLLYVLGLLEVGSHRTDRAPSLPSLIVGAIVCAIGFSLLTRLRTYLLIPMLLPVLGTLIVLVWPAFVAGRKVRKRQVAVASGVLAFLLVFLVSPQLGRVQQYSDLSTPPLILPRAGSAEAEQWKESFQQNSGSSSMNRTVLLAWHSCTIAWRRSPVLPRFLDSKLEALSCAREDFLRFCDQSLLGRHADRFCDDVTLMSAVDVLKHIPKGISFGLLTPYPRMWMDGFGSGGTGMRRAGYAIDGAIAYLLLIGLLGLVPISRSRPDLLVLVVCVIGIVTIFALAIPSQFILARIRLALYVPLLAFGAIGWLSMLRSRQTET